MYASRIKKIRAFKDGGIAHRYFCAEPAIAQIRPVADLAVADAHDIREPMPGHCGQEDRLGGVGKDDLGTFFFVPCLGSTPRRSKTVLRERPIPGKDCVLRDQDVRITVAGDVHETKVRILGGDIGNRLEPREWLPTSV